MGQAAVRVLGVFGYALNGWSRTPHSLPGITCYSGRAELEPFLEGTDIIVSLLPLTPVAITPNVADLDLNVEQLRSYLAKEGTWAPYRVFASTGVHIRTKDWVTSLDRAPDEGFVDLVGPPMTRKVLDAPMAKKVTTRTIQLKHSSGNTFTPTHDIMAYSSDPVDLAKCVSTLNVEGFALQMSNYLDTNGDRKVDAKDVLVPNDLAGDGLSSFQVQNPKDHWYASSTGQAEDCPQPDWGAAPVATETDWGAGHRPDDGAQAEHRVGQGRRRPSGVERDGLLGLPEGAADRAQLDHRRRHR